MGLIPRTTTTTLNKIIYNSYQLVDLPLLLGYNIIDKRNWNLQVEGGALLNLSLQTEGILPTENFEDISLENNQETLYRPKLGIRYQFGLNMHWKMTNHLRLGFGTKAQFFPTSISTENNALSQKYSLIGGNIRLQYKF